jgi:hypothetical protein
MVSGWTRREFFTAIAGCAVLPAAASAEEKYLLLDTRILERARGARLTLGTVHKHPEPLFVEDKPWEPRFDNLYANVLYDEEEELYKCWYSPFIVDSATSNTPREKRAEVKWHGGADLELGICYATSKDGIVWQKPELGLVEFQGSRRNNIVLRADPELGEVHGAGIAKDTRELDGSRRYKMLFNRFNRHLPRSDPRCRYMCVGFSADGLKWSDFRPCPEIAAPGDTHSNWFWAPALRKYVGITRLFGDAQRRQRLVARTESPDFLHWDRAEVVLRALASEPNRQTYAMPAFPYAGLYLGLPMLINLNGRHDTVDCELAWSSDTVHWDRVCPGTPLIPRGPEGAHDSKCLFGAFHPIIRGDEIRLYYGGNNGEHGDFRDGFFCLARLRLDGFAAMEPEDSSVVAEITTCPLRCTAPHLRVNADASNGVLGVAVVDEGGLRLAEAHPLHGDAVDDLVRWRHGQHLPKFIGRSVRLQFHLKRTRLYAFRFAER